jgi:hypothetical protein
VLRATWHPPADEPANKVKQNQRGSEMMLIINTEKAIIYGQNGRSFYSVMDGSIDIYDPEELTAEEYDIAIAELTEIIKNND